MEKESLNTIKKRLEKGRNDFAKKLNELRKRNIIMMKAAIVLQVAFMLLHGLLLNNVFGTLLHLGFTVFIDFRLREYKKKYPPLKEDWESE